MVVGAMTLSLCFYQDTRSLTRYPIRQITLAQRARHLCLYAKQQRETMSMMTRSSFQFKLVGNGHTELGDLWIVWPSTTIGNPYGERNESNEKSQEGKTKEFLNFLIVWCTFLI